MILPVQLEELETQQKDNNDYFPVTYLYSSLELLFNINRSARAYTRIAHGGKLL